MKKFILFPIAFGLFLLAGNLRGQDTLRFTVCPKMWSTGAAVKIESVSVSVSNPAFPVGQMFFYPVAGSNCVEVVIPPDKQIAGATYHVSGDKIGDGANGLTSNDLLVLRQHILGVVPFDHPAQFFIGDVNNSGGSTTTYDMVLIARKILGIPDGADFGWYSLPGYWDFSGGTPSNPLNQPACCENLSLAELQAYDGGSMDLVFYKKGDLDGDANPQLDDFFPDFTDNFRVGLLGSTSIVAGQNLDVEVWTNSVGKGIGSLQLEFEIDQDAVEILDVKSADFAMSFNVEGTLLKITGSANLASPIFPTVPIFTIKAKGKTSSTVKNAFKLVQQSFPALASVGDKNAIALAEIGLDYFLILDSGEPSAADFSEVRIAPNPTNGAAVLTFDSKISADTELIFTDLNGKIVLRKFVAAAAGSNRVEIAADVFPASGVYFFRMNFGENTCSGRLVRI